MLTKSILKLDEESFEDPEILIRGYGKLTLSQAKQWVKRTLEEADRMVKEEANFSGMKNMLFNGTLEAVIDAINRAESSHGEVH